MKTYESILIAVMQCSKMSGWHEADDGMLLTTTTDLKYTKNDISEGQSETMSLTKLKSLSLRGKN